MSQFLIKLLVAEYIIIMITCLLEHNWWRAFYWLGACILNIGVLGGMR